MADCLFISSGASSKKQIIQQLKIRVGQSAPNARPIYIAPEGGTTNGRYLLPFRSGAFYNLNGVDVV